MIYQLLYIAGYAILRSNGQSSKITNPTGMMLEDNLTHLSKSNPIQNHDRSREVSEIKAALESYQKEIDKLNVKAEQLKKKLENTKHNCDLEFNTLNKKQEALLKNSTEKQRRLQDLLNKINYEEEVHRTLLLHLQRLDVIMELQEYQYTLMNLELKLAEGRRNNGTLAQCEQVTLQLNADAQETLFMLRSSMSTYKIKKRSKTKEDRDVIVLRNKFNILRLMRNKLLKAVDQGENEFQSELESCSNKKSDLNNLMHDTKIMIETQDKSIEFLTKKLNKAKEFSRSVRIEIESGKRFIGQLKTLLDNLRKESKTYKADLKCYDNVKNLD